MFIDARNEHVKTGLRDAYRERAGGRELEVFCVSNRLYEKHAQKGNAEAVHASGIPAVRRFCHAVSADVQLYEAQHYLRSSLFSLVSSLHIWSSGAVRDRQEPTISEETTRLLGQALDTAVCQRGRSLFCMARAPHRNSKGPVPMLIRSD